MVKKKLVVALIADGARLLCELDRQNFPVDAMFWVHFPEEDYWRLVIASPLVNQQGGLAGYRRVNELLRGIEMAGITLEDISLVDPASSQFRSFLSLASSSGRLATGPEWVEFEEAVVYRWTSASVSAELTCDVSSRDLIRLWEAERKLSNQPVLLITSDKRRVTLRFHPQHGPHPGIENVKGAFQIALQRERTDCQVKWN
jgi:hypothetical protein